LLKQLSSSPQARHVHTSQHCTLMCIVNSALPQPPFHLLHCLKFPVGNRNGDTSRINFPTKSTKCCSASFFQFVDETGTKACTKLLNNAPLSS
jgi:hypothetical protein